MRFLTEQRLITALVLPFGELEQVDRRENFLVAELGEGAQGGHDRPNQLGLLKGFEGGQTAGHRNLKDSFSLLDLPRSLYNQVSPLFVANFYTVRFAPLARKQRQTANVVFVLLQSVFIK